MIAAAVALLAVAALAAFLLLRDDEEESAEPARARAELATLEELRELASDADGTVFWAGPRPGTRYEVSRTDDGRIYIRYLPAGVEPGDPRGNYLTIGTYPSADALADVRQRGETEGAVARELADGAVAVYNDLAPTSVYVAFPGVDRLVEVFHPLAEEAREVAYSGALVPILADAPPEQTGEPVAVTEEELRQVAADADHPVYWLGPREGIKYELTRLPNGQIYVRYLPEDVEIGSADPRYETVGTYPNEDPVAAVEAEAERTGAETFELPGGGVAYYSEAAPTNVHFALPGAEVQVEVFHPEDGRAEQLVRARAVVPIE